MGKIPLLAQRCLNEECLGGLERGCPPVLGISYIGVQNVDVLYHPDVHTRLYLSGVQNVDVLCQ